MTTQSTTITGDAAGRIHDLQTRLSGLYDLDGAGALKFRSPEAAEQIAAEAAAVLQVTTAEALAILLHPQSATAADGAGVTFTYQTAATE